MKYVNAKEVLPDPLVKELQGYIQGGYLYVPASPDRKKRWGEVSGYRRELKQRNNEITRKYNNGCSMDDLADQYGLSIHTIRKIIYQK